MKIKIQTSSKAKDGDGKIKITINKNYYVIKAVIFNKSQADILRNAADKAVVIK